jgi:hypothetical protein
MVMSEDVAINHAIFHPEYSSLVFTANEGKGISIFDVSKISSIARIGFYNDHKDFK